MRKNQPTGRIQAIRELLDKEGPLRRDQIASRLGLTNVEVGASLDAMLSRLGGACYAGSEGRFRLYGKPRRDDESLRRRRDPNVAGPKYQPAPGVLSRDPFAGMRLALAGPR